MLCSVINGAAPILPTTSQTSHGRNHGRVLLNGLSILAKGELQSLCCMMGKTMPLRCHFWAVNGWRLID